MTIIHSSLPHIHGNVMAAVDLETSGSVPGYHDILQIAVVPLDSELRPLKTVRAFNRYIKPLHPEREDKKASKVHKLDINELYRTAADPGRIADLLLEWWEALDLPFERKLVPLAQNWGFERSFLINWLGESHFEKMFHVVARDTMVAATYLNDEHVFRGEIPPFDRVNLTDLCNKLGVENARPHDAFHDCLAEAEVYRKLVSMREF